MLLFFLLQHLGYSTLLIKWQIFYKIHWSEVRNCSFVLRLLGVKQYFGVLRTRLAILHGESSLRRCRIGLSNFLASFEENTHDDNSSISRRIIPLSAVFFFCTGFPLFLLFLVMTLGRRILLFPADWEELQSFIVIFTIWITVWNTWF